MHHKIRTFLIFVIPAVVVFMASSAFLSLANEEGSDLDSRVRYLDIASDNKSRHDARSEIYIEGEISETMVKEFKETVDRHHPTSAIVIFDSEGGEMYAALELGYLIHELGYSTSVGGYTQSWNEVQPGECYSACTLAYLGGNYRYFNTDSEFGVHQYRSVGVFNSIESSIESDAQDLSGHILKYIKEMGVDSEFYQQTVQQENEGINMLSLEELKRMNVVNNGALPATWNLSLIEGRPILTGSQDRFGQSGEIVISCNDGAKIAFLGMSVTKALMDDSRKQFSLVTDSTKMAITDQVTTTVAPDDSRDLSARFKPTNDQLLTILGSNSFGLEASDNQDIKRIRTIDIDKDRSKFAEYLRQCKL